MQEQYPYSERAYSVIMLDDNDILLSMAMDMYAHYGIRCDVCTNTSDLMEAMRTKDYDLLITDLKMPEINGFEVLELLRSSHVGNSKTIPVIVATASEAAPKKNCWLMAFPPACSSRSACRNCWRCRANAFQYLLSKITREKQPDLSSLLAYGDKVTMLDKLKTETEKDMQAISDAERCDRKNWICRYTVYAVRGQ